VNPGDCLSSIGARFGFTVEALWNLPENADLKNLRKDPWILNPGDRVFIPELRIKHHDRSTDQRHKFQKKGVKELLKIVFIDEDEKPMCNVPYELIIDDQDHFAGHTNGNGTIEHPILPTAAKGRIAIGPLADRREYYLQLGGVDPVTEISGAKGRLLDLGYLDDPPDNKMNGQTESALLLFQDRHKLRPTGKNDEATQAKLTAVFGC
jgi:hypothetical protein